MSIMRLFFIIIIALFSSQAISIAGSPDDSKSDSIQINSSSFPSFVDSMDNLGFDNIFFKRATDEYKSKVEDRFEEISKTKDANKIFNLFQSELNENPHYAYKIYNETLIHIYDLSPRNFEKNSIVLKNSLIDTLSQPKDPESNIIYTDELDCGAEENYVPCKKLYQKKFKLPLILFLMLPVFI